MKYLPPRLRRLPGLGLAATAALLASSPVGAAGTPIVDTTARVIVQRVGPPPVGGAQGRLARQANDEISPAQREAIWARLRSTLRELPRPDASLAAQPTLTWPLKASSRLPDPDYHGISNFVDLNPAFPNQLRDFQCGGRSYDTASGYNHKGIDYFTWPFGWLKMSQSLVQVVAAAPGRVIGKDDGNPDQSCSFNGNDWNAVYVEHFDGSIAWYGHLKNGSVTAKAVGDSVARGEVLGVVGSSGNSTGPHLHLELYDAAGQLVEPHVGACNALASLWWQAQRPYLDSKINQVITGHAPVNFGTCPALETPNIRDSFDPGQPIYFTTFYHDQPAGMPSTYTVRRPDGVVWAQWTHASPATYSASWWYWYFTLPTSGPYTGTWRFTVQFNGQTEDRFFNVASPTQVTVRIPNGGKTYARGSSLNIRWVANIGGPVRIELWANGQYDRTIAGSTPNDGEARWTIPGTITPGTKYRIRVINLADESVLDSSDRAFSIQ